MCLFLCDVVIMNHDGFDYAIDDIMIDMLWLIKIRHKFIIALTLIQPPLSVAIVSNTLFIVNNDIFWSFDKGP